MRPSPTTNGQLRPAEGKVTYLRDEFERLGAEALHFLPLLLPLVREEGRFEIGGKVQEKMRVGGRWRSHSGASQVLDLAPSQEASGGSWVAF